MQHIRRHIEICYNAVLQGLNGDYRAWRAADHCLCLVARCKHAARFNINRNNGWLPNQNSAFSVANQRVFSAEVNADVFGKYHL